MTRILRLLLLIGWILFPEWNSHAQVEWSGTEVTLIANREYTGRIYKLIRSAKQSIRICLEKCEYPEDGDHIIRRLLQEVAYQSQRGVDVEFILENDGKSKKVHSNAQVRDFLKSSGVTLYSDSTKQRTSCNMIIVDGFTAVVGSTDWTHDSFSRDNPLTLWIESSDFCEILMGRFNEIVALGKE